MSISVPKYLILLCDFIRWSFQLTWKSVTVLNFQFGNKNAFRFTKVRINFFVEKPSTTWFQFFIEFLIDTFQVFMGKHNMHIVEIYSEHMLTDKSLSWQRKSKDPRTLFCGTPHLLSVKLDYVPLTLTSCVLPVKYY